MLPKAYLVHRIRTRSRIRIPDKCKDRDFFISLQEQLSSLEVLSEIEVSEISGSVLLIHPDHGFDVVRSDLESLGLFELVMEKPPTLTPMEAVSAKIGRADSTIREISVGGLDLRTVAFIGALLLTLQQAARGNFSGPAIPMLLAALSLINTNGGNSPGSE